MNRQRQTFTPRASPFSPLQPMSSTTLITVLFIITLMVITATPASSARMLDAAAPTSISTSNPADGLISAACQRAQYPDVCSSTLRSHPRSPGATDLQGLADISLGLAIAHARETLELTRHLARSGAYNDTYAAGCLHDCLDLYNDAIADLEESRAALRQKMYDTVNAQVSGAMADAETCEDGFEDNPGYSSPLTERNGYFHKLCSNSLAITSVLTV